MSDENKDTEMSGKAPEDQGTSQGTSGLFAGGSGGQSADFRIEGQVQLETMETVPGEMQLRAYAFDRLGHLLGTADVDPRGSFSMPVRLADRADVEVFIGPVEDAQSVRESAAYSQSFGARDWTQEGRTFRLRPNFVIPKSIWEPWKPVRICVSGHVHKVHTTNGHTEICPVPYVKVEVFDVDREGCWWPYIVRWWDLLLDRPVIRIPDLMKDRVLPRRPFPPDPIGPISRWGSRVDPLQRVALNPQPEPPSYQLGGWVNPSDLVALNPQPEPPLPWRISDRLGNPIAGVTISPVPEPPSISSRSMTTEQVTPVSGQTTAGRVGEVSKITTSIAEHLDNLTLTTRIPPWVIFPRCFYSRRLVCETHTDCAGYFRCCFSWWPLHFRRGRLRFDSRPDLIIRLTQLIDGVARVIYMDPYTSTRWNVTNAHIDLYLDNEDVQCGSPNCPNPQPPEHEVYFALIGQDEVYKIDQGNGLYPNATSPDVDLTISNLAYGGGLRIYANFGRQLSTGAPKRFYRLSYAKRAMPGVTPPDAAFQPITMPPGGLTDTRVHRLTLISETYHLGPQTVGTQQGLYEVRDTENYSWYDQEKIADWWSWVDEPDTGTYVLRMEVFDEAGNKLTTASGQVDYRDGTHAPTTPPTPLPAMTDHCDLVITLDNKGVDVLLHTPATNDCGLIVWTSGLTLDFGVNVSQGHGRLHAWGLYYTKGTDPTIQYLDSGSSNSGTPDPVSKTVTVPSNDPTKPMIYNLSGTCAYALKLWGYAHITDGTHNWYGGHNYIYYNESLQAIAIEKCPPCPTKPPVAIAGEAL